MYKRQLLCNRCQALHAAHNIILRRVDCLDLTPDIVNRNYHIADLRIPVSYTHLDVYKRQILLILDQFLCKFVQVGINQPDQSVDSVASLAVQEILS